MKFGTIPGSRYFRVGNEYYCTSSFHSEMWEECLKVFDEVIVMDRTIIKDKIEAGFKPVLTKNVSFIELPNFFGPMQILFVIPKMFMAARKAVKKADVWHLSAGSFPSLCLWFWLWFYKIPYSIELRGEQGMNVDYLRMRGTSFPRLIAVAEKIILWLERLNAIAAVGVAKFLIDIYGPLDKNAPRFAISDSRVPAEMYKEPRVWKNDSKERIIVTLGRVEAQKNPLGTMEMLSYLDKKGFKNWKFKWIGGGPLLTKTQKLAAELGILDKVEFLGFVPWQEVFGILGNADLFVLNTVSEGMSRAILEAMACGLPTVSTNICGMPEVLPSEDLVPPKNPQLLADKIYEILSDPERMSRMSKKNIETAKNYSAEVLAEKKIAFYKWLRTYAENRNKK